MATEEITNSIENNGSEFSSNFTNFTSDYEDSFEMSPLFAFFLFWKLLCIVVMATGLIGNLFIIMNFFTNPQMRNTNYFFVLNLVIVDLFVIIGVLVIKEIALATQTDNPFLLCFPTVWNFVVNYTASNYILLFLCYEKLIIIIFPFKKQEYLNMKVKATFTVSIYVLTVLVGVVKIHNMDPSRGTQWCAFSYPVVSEWQSDLCDVTFFIAPIALQIALYSYIFTKAKQVRNRFNPTGVANDGGAGAGANHAGGGGAGGAPLVAPPRRREQPQLRVARTCLVATLIRFTLWLPYVIHLVKLAVKQGVGVTEAHERSYSEQLADTFLPDLTIFASCTNPIVFIAMSPPLQRRLKGVCDCFKKICCFFPCGKLCGCCRCCECVTPPSGGNRGIETTTGGPNQDVSHLDDGVKATSV